jgi:hypothetical protein
MKRHLSTIVNGRFITGFTLLTMAGCRTLPVMTQKEMPIVTQEQISEINELVKPLKDRINKQLSEDRTGNYKAYLKDLKNMSSIKNAKQRISSTNRIMEKYSGFFKTIWEAANVDEPLYQTKIRHILHDEDGRRTEFQQYLNFAFSSSSSPSPIPEPAPPNQCIDVCTIAAGEIKGDSALISNGGGAYGNCFLKISAWGATLGHSDWYGFLRNNIKIPGTFPSDDRRLRVKKHYELRQSSTAFAALGFGYAETRLKTYQSSEYLLTMAPVLFASSKSTSKTISEEYVLEKKDIAQSVFRTYGGTFAYFVSGNWAYTDCDSIEWTVCEE